MKRREFLKAVALPAVIPAIDYRDWVPNTDAGLDPGFARDLGISGLLPLPSLGPYYRYLWIDKDETDPLPVVLAETWVSYRDLKGESATVGINVGDGWRTVQVTDLVHTSWPGEQGSEPTLREALMRLIRVMIREHHGYPTTYST